MLSMGINVQRQKLSTTIKPNKAHIEFSLTPITVKISDLCLLMALT